MESKCFGRTLPAVIAGVNAVDANDMRQTEPQHSIMELDDDPDATLFISEVSGDEKEGPLRASTLGKGKKGRVEKALNKGQAMQQNGNPPTKNPFQFNKKWPQTTPNHNPFNTDHNAKVSQPTNTDPSVSNSATDESVSKPKDAPFSFPMSASSQQNPFAPEKPFAAASKAFFGPSSSILQGHKTSSESAGGLWAPQSSSVEPPSLHIDQDIHRHPSSVNDEPKDGETALPAKTLSPFDPNWPTATHGPQKPAAPLAPQKNGDVPVIQLPPLSPTLNVGTFPQNQSSNGLRTPTSQPTQISSTTSDRSGLNSLAESPLFSPSTGASLQNTSPHPNLETTTISHSNPNISPAPSPKEQSPLIHDEQSLISKVKPATIDKRATAIDKLSNAIVIEKGGLLQQFLEYSMDEIIEASMHRVRDQKSWATAS